MIFVILFNIIEIQNNIIFFDIAEIEKLIFPFFWLIFSGQHLINLFPSQRNYQISDFDDGYLKKII